MPLNHQQKVLRLQQQLIEHRQSGSEKQIRFRHGGTNATRPKQQSKYTMIDTSDLNQVLRIDTENQIAVAEANVPMDQLVKETLKYNLIPQVVVEFPGITVGGAVQGAALESTSFRFGQFDETCVHYEVITPDGEIRQCSKDENAELFYGIVGSYGSICLITSVTFRLMDAAKFVALQYIPVTSFAEMVAKCREYASQQIDFVDGIMFAKDKGVLLVGHLEDAPKHPVQTFANATDPWFFLHAKKMSDQHHTECVPIVDYFFRYDRGAFWMGDYVFDILKLPRWDICKRVFNAFFTTRNLYRGLHHANYFQAFFIQDIYFPADTVTKYLEFVDQHLGIYPIWLCPMKPTRNPAKLSPAYIDTDFIINVGLWGRSAAFANPIDKNRQVEKLMIELRGRKMLYSQQYLSEEQFWQVYDQDWYNQLRQTFQAPQMFPTVYEKTIVRKEYKPTPIRGFFRFYWSLLTNRF